MNDISYISYMQSPLGCIEIKATESHVVSILFTDESKNDNLQIIKNQPEIIQQCINELTDYFSGQLKEFTVPVTQYGTDFQLKVWNALLNIPYGIIISYADLAKQLGDKNLTRAVGLANSKNKISIIVPCHRVIGANKSLTGYAGGLERKRWLLIHETKNAKQQGMLF